MFVYLSIPLAVAARIGELSCRNIQASQRLRRWHIFVFQQFQFFHGPRPNRRQCQVYLVSQGLLTFSYLTESEASSEGIIYNYDGVSYFGVNYWSVQANRDSVRLQSKASYSEVLIIAEFDYAPGSYIPPSVALLTHV
jgi:hypothetical protein